jgi:hypothetical protein
MTSRHSRLLLLALAAVPLSTCMLPRSEMLREDVHHLRTHAALSARYGPSCLPERKPPDPSTEAPRPDPSEADHTFVGDVDGMREHVFLHQHDGTYDYVERWDVGVPGVKWEILNVGWDWKVDCRVEQCVLPDGVVCCYQECAGGGSSGMAYEAPNRFGCMNEAVGGVFQWFLEGLDEAGVPNVDGCRPQRQAYRSRSTTR